MMEPIPGGYGLPRVLLTVVTLGYGFLTMKADLNRTHATNPRWTPHARFHVVWQTLSYGGLALIALCLIWAPGPLSVERLYLAAAFGAIVFGAFFVALFARRLFGGALYDDNGSRPVRVKFGKTEAYWDGNVIAFTVLSFILIVAVVATWYAK